MFHPTRLPLRKKTQHLVHQLICVQQKAEFGPRPPLMNPRVARTLHPLKAELKKLLVDQTKPHGQPLLVPQLKKLLPWPRALPLQKGKVWKCVQKKLQHSRHLPQNARALAVTRQLVLLKCH